MVKFIKRENEFTNGKLIESKKYSIGAECL